ncbi:MAG: methionyl-tRNA formyltransferase [Synergistaceae bacterium]|jgi:methionyl-tRNA formyltransferase|nr:methionyl-tRNA formyltransferase [Synergistaceae bacterium]
MRLLLIGQKAFGADALLALAKDGAEIVGAVVGSSDRDREDQVETVARDLKIDCVRTGSLKKPDVAQWVSERRPDLIAMAFVTLYMPKSLANVAPLGAINFHPSLLPLHRGISSLPWTILSGDTAAGLSIYFVDESMDTGDVVVQKRVEISDDDDFKSLYFKKIYPLGLSAICEAVRLVASGNPPRIKQDDSASSYDPPLGREHLVLDWSDPVEMNSRRIRAGNPGIGGVTRMDDGAEVRAYGCKKYGATSTGGAPGRILSVDESGILVQGADGALLLTNLCVSGEAKLNGAEFAAKYGISEGRRFIGV